MLNYVGVTLKLNCSMTTYFVLYILAQHSSQVSSSELALYSPLAPVFMNRDADISMLQQGHFEA